jgi:hypothetical protein
MFGLPSHSVLNGTRDFAAQIGDQMVAQAASTLAPLVTELLESDISDFSLCGCQRDQQGELAYQRLHFGAKGIHARAASQNA